MASFNLKEKLDFGALIKKYSIVSLIFAVIGLAIGVLFIISPLFTHSIFIWIALGLIALIGLYAIIRFIVPGKGKPRDGFSFAFGILVVAAFAILLACALLTPAGKVDGEQLSGFAIFTLGLVRFFAIFFGVVAVFYSIWELCMIGNVEKGKKGWAIFSAILGIILGVLMIVFPFVFKIVQGIIVGVYFIIISIFTIVVAIKALVAAKKIKKEIKDSAIEAEIKE